MRQEILQRPRQSCTNRKEFYALLVRVQDTVTQLSYWPPDLEQREREVRIANKDAIDRWNLADPSLDSISVRSSAGHGRQ
jgi:hypothetical protein